MKAPRRPARAFLTLIVSGIVALGVAAYLVNIPLLWVGAGELIAIGTVFWRVTRQKRPELIASGTETQSAEPK